MKKTFQELFADQIIKQQNYNSLIVAGIPSDQATRIAFGEEEARKIQETLITIAMREEVEKRTL